LTLLATTVSTVAALPQAPTHNGQGAAAKLMPRAPKSRKKIVKDMKSWEDRPRELRRRSKKNWTSQTSCQWGGSQKEWKDRKCPECSPLDGKKSSFETLQNP
jgi:hypothetical protein